MTLFYKARHFGIFVTDFINMVDVCEFRLFSVLQGCEPCTFFKKDVGNYGLSFLVNVKYMIALVYFERHPVLQASIEDHVEVSLE